MREASRPPARGGDDTYPANDSQTEDEAAADRIAATRATTAAKSTNGIHTTGED
jgi:hypothetical protein